MKQDISVDLMIKYNSSTVLKKVQYAFYNVLSID